MHCTSLFIEIAMCTEQVLFNSSFHMLKHFITNSNIQQLPLFLTYSNIQQLSLFITNNNKQQLPLFITNNNIQHLPLFLTNSNIHQLPLGSIYSLTPVTLTHRYSGVGRCSTLCDKLHADGERLSHHCLLNIFLGALPPPPCLPH